MAKSNFIQEFKDFALKGNAVDMAVAVVIGGAFGKIVTSIVSDIIMPLVGYATGGVNFTDLKWELKPAVGLPDAADYVAAVTVNYGNFIQTTIDFLIIAFCIFLVIKALMGLKKKEETIIEEVTPPAPSNEEVLLGEIRDLLKNK